MARVEGVDPEQVSDEYTARVLAAQAKTWGAPLLNHLVYARRPSINAAVGSKLGVPGYASSPVYDEAERVALEYADCMTVSGREVDDALFARLRRFYDEDALVELTAIIAWENSSSKFNHALRIPSQGLWRRA
jgi:alkylhydroperoxidase family enzyme